MKTAVSEKGQVTIPKPLRDSLGLSPGVALDFREEQGRLVATRLVTADPLDRLVGLVHRMDVDLALERLRGPRWNPKRDARRP